jgi:hypothetical protein
MEILDELDLVKRGRNNKTIEPQSHRATEKTHKGDPQQGFPIIVPSSVKPPVSPCLCGSSFPVALPSAKDSNLSFGTDLCPLAR